MLYNNRLYLSKQMVKMSGEKKFAIIMVSKATSYAHSIYTRGGWGHDDA